MSFSREYGLGRDPKYPGKFGIPEDIINTPQKPAQWWAVALLALLVALPVGAWDMLDDLGEGAVAGYIVLCALALLNAWFLRNDINETHFFLGFALVSGAVLVVGASFLAAFEAFPEDDWLAGGLILAAGAIALHNLYRAWQGLLIIGLFTEQPVPPDSPFFKG